eukprot:153131_1
MANKHLIFVAFTIILCIIQPYICPRFPFLPLIPIGIGMYKFGDGKRRVDNILLCSIYCAYYAIVMYPISYVLYFIPYHWSLLWSYSVVFFIANRDLLHLDSNTLSDKLWFRLWMKFFFTIPLLLAYKIVSKLNGQLSAPLISIIDDNICVGGLPPSTEKDVLKLYNEPYNIRGVINLCDEAIGPMFIYEKFNIQFLQLKTIDSLPPTIDDIDVGINFIQKIMQWKNKENNGIGRVFIHCKLGRGRSVTMALCWLLSQGIKPNDATAKIQSCRKVAATKSVLKYNTTKHFIKKYSQ